MRRIVPHLVALVMALASAVPAQNPRAKVRRPSYRVIDGFSFAHQSTMHLVHNQSVRAALHVTDEQSQEQQKIAEAMHYTPGDSDRWEKEYAKAEAALVATLEPAQQARLDQISLQIQGPAAFATEELPARLHLAPDQLAGVRPIAEKVRWDIDEAATFQHPFNFRDPKLTPTALRKYVESEGFRAAKLQAWQAAVEVRASANEKIESSLTDAQRNAYKEMLGEPFEVAGVFEWALGSSNPAGQTIAVAQQFCYDGVGADPDFDAKLARPAYTKKHPSVLFDQAHKNLHTTRSSFKPFVALIRADGYAAMPNLDPLTAKLLAKHDILVCVDAVRSLKEQQSALTPGECEAVADWVKRGGSLLLAADDPPSGAGFAPLAKAFGVDMNCQSTNDDVNRNDYGLLFSREKELLGDHAILNGREPSERVNRVLTFHGQSLKGPPGSGALLKLAATATDWGDEMTISAAGRTQGIAFIYGKGRVVVMGEADALSAQVSGETFHRMGMNAPDCDNRQFVLNIMHWLSGLTD